MSAGREARSRPVRWPILAVTLALAGPAVAAGPGPGVADRLAYYHRRVEHDPGHYPSWAGLGLAYLAAARQSHDPGDLARAEQALDRSLALQPNYEALKGQAKLANFRHRFDQAVGWARQACETWPADPEPVALLVEAWLGLGRPDRAAAVLEQSRGQEPSFHRAAARGHWLKAEERWEEAAAAFLEAGELATRQGVPDLAVWAEVSAGGALLDGGQLPAAGALFDQVAARAPGDRLLLLHLVELDQAEGRLARALAGAEALLAESADPELSLRAFALAERLGDEPGAARHFEAARRGFETVTAAGERFALEGLARLYLEAGREPDLALDLARANLAIRHDRSAWETLACAEQRLAGR